MRRPIVGLSLFFAAGIWTGLRVDAPAGLLPVSLAAAAGAWVAAAVLLALHRNRSGTLCIHGLAGLLGLASCTGHRTADSGLEAIANTLPEPITCSVEGSVNRDPMEIQDGTHDRFIQFGLQCDTLTVEGSRHTVSQPLLVTLYGAPRFPPVYGERWALEGTLRRGRDRGGRVGQWMLRTGLARSRRIEQAGRSLPALAQKLRRTAAAILAHGIEKQQDVTGVVNALLLGYRTLLPPETQRSFVNTGTMHIFAISGLHVAILCSVLVSMISLLRVPRTGWVYALAPVILLYALTTGSRASAVRAGIMASAYLLAPATGRRPDTVSALALAGILILAWKPEQLMDIGCIFSFAAVAGILAIVPVLEGMLQRYLRPDPLAVPELTDAAPWWRIPARWLAQLAAVSLAAWLTSMPLSLYYFGRFTPVALVANLLVIPLSFLIITTCCLSLVAGAGIGLWLAGILNAANVVFVRLLTGGMRVLEMIPYGHADGLRITLPAMTIWYLLLACMVVILRNPLRQKAMTEHPGFDI